MDIDKAIRRYNKLASRRDERINRPALDEIAAKLAAQVPPGQRNDVDLLLGRPEAVLPERDEYQTQPNSTQAEIDRQQRIYEQLTAVKEAWTAQAEQAQRVEYQMRPATDTAAATEAVAELAQTKQDEFLTYISDQFGDWLDWHRLCGDLAI